MKRFAAILASITVFAAFAAFSDSQAQQPPTPVPPTTPGVPVTPVPPASPVIPATPGNRVIITRQADSQTPDAKFVLAAASGGMLEVKLGELAQKQAESAEVKQFASKMVTDHTKANNKLKTIAQQASLGVPIELLPKHKASYDKLKNADSASFDREYIKCMVKDHKEAIELFQRGMNLQQPQLRAFASETLPVIREHAKMARELASEMGVKTDEDHDHDKKNNDREKKDDNDREKKDNGDNAKDKDKNDSDRDR